MIVVRDIFALKFGNSKEAVGLWKERLEIGRRIGHDLDKARLLIDLVGPYSTLVLETQHESLAEYERFGKAIMADERWRAWYP